MESASDLIRQVSNSKLRIAVLQEEEHTRRKQHVDEEQRVKYDVYQPQIRDLEHKRDEEISQLGAAYEKLQQGTQSEIEQHVSVVKVVESILNFLRIRPAVDPIADDAIKSHHVNGYAEALPHLFDTPHLKIRLFIVENGKPKNKYSLAALGNTSFQESLLKLERSYGCDFYTVGNICFPLEVCLKDAPAVDALKAYLERTRPQILARLTGDYDGVEAEWEEVVASYKVEDFKDILVWRCGCGYFSTTLDDDYTQKNKNCVRCGEILHAVMA